MLANHLTLPAMLQSSWPGAVAPHGPRPTKRRVGFLEDGMVQSLRPMKHEILSNFGFTWFNCSIMFMVETPSEHDLWKRFMVQLFAAGASEAWNWPQWHFSWWRLCWHPFLSSRAE